jgi:ankyrin repeat protein
MSEVIIENNPCGVHKKQAVYEVGGEWLKSQRCLKCNDIFEVCTKCSDKQCPVCDGILKNKNDTFPDNFFIAVKNNKFDKIKSVLATENVFIDEVFDKNGDTALVNAAMSQNIEMCTFLIEQCYASPLSRNKDGRTPLIEMMRCRNGKGLKTLILLFRSTVNEQDASGKTALMFASTGAGVFGSKKGNITLIQQLLDLGANIHCKDKYGNTALIYAIESNKKSKTNNNEEVVCYLESKVILQTAMDYFRSDFSYNFTEGGELIIHKRK